jgi:hypothetical protein
MSTPEHSSACHDHDLDMSTPGRGVGAFSNEPRPLSVSSSPRREAFEVSPTSVMAEVESVLPVAHASAMTKDTAASVVEIAKDPPLSVIAEPLLDNPSTPIDDDVSTLGRLVTFDEFSWKEHPKKKVRWGDHDGKGSLEMCKRFSKEEIIDPNMHF